MPIKQVKAKEPKEAKPQRADKPKNAKRALGPGPGYASVYPEPGQARAIAKWAAGCGIKGVSPPRSMHVTLLYDKRNKRFDVEQRRGALYAARPVTVEIFGKKRDTLVLVLNSKDLAARHQAIIDAGHQHGFPQFRPHITIKEGATDEDFLAAVACVDRLLKAIPKITLFKETWTKVDANWTPKKAAASVETALDYDEALVALEEGTAGEDGTLKLFTHMVSSLQRFSGKVLYWDDMETADNGDATLRVRLYTDNNRYSIVAKENLEEGSYMGCIAWSRKHDIEESWTRGNDLADGELNRATWNNILNDIVAYELSGAARELLAKTGKWSPKKLNNEPELAAIEAVGDPLALVAGRLREFASWDEWYEHKMSSILEVEAKPA